MNVQSFLNKFKPLKEDTDSNNNNYITETPSNSNNNNVNIKEDKPSSTPQEIKVKYVISPNLLEILKNHKLKDTDYSNFQFDVNVRNNNIQAREIKALRNKYHSMIELSPYKGKNRHFEMIFTAFSEAEVMKRRALANKNKVWVTMNAVLPSGYPYTEDPILKISCIEGLSSLNEKRLQRFMINRVQLYFFFKSWRKKINFLNSTVKTTSWICKDDSFNLFTKRLDF